jgi:nucleotide-binding universal stress UspA family protein
MNILLPVDGSPSSDRAVDYVIKMRGWFKSELAIHVLNVQHSLPYGRAVGKVVSHDVVEKYHQEEGMAALKSARAKLDAAGVKYKFHIGIGAEADVIAAYAKEHGCEQICMGSRGLGSVANVVLGSVATKVIHVSAIPVLLVK